MLCSPASCSRPTPAATPHLPVQQSRRVAPGAVVLGGRRVRNDASYRRWAVLRWLLLAGRRAWVSASWPRTLQAFLVLPGFAARATSSPVPGTWWRRIPRVWWRWAFGECFVSVGFWFVAILVSHPRGPVASVHRRFAEQQLLECVVRLQRLRPTHRKREAAASGVARRVLSRALVGARPGLTSDVQPRRSVTAASWPCPPRLPPCRRPRASSARAAGRPDAAWR